MNSLVLELQREAYLQDTPISVLVRKAYTLARKLELKELIEWTHLELNGYSNEKEVPAYRNVKGHLKALNPFHGYIPAYFPELDNVLTSRVMYNSIAEIEQFIQQGNENGGMMMYKFDTSVQLTLMKLAQADFELSLHIPVTQFSKIIDNVRNVILEWTLKLEEEGILGENMTFNDKEKQAANQIPSVTNIIGTMVNSQLQQNSDNSTQSISVGEFKVENLKEIVEQGKVLLEQITDDETKAEVNSELTVLQAQIDSPKPKKTIIKESLASIRNIAEGATGSVLVSLVPKIVEVLSTL